MDVHARPDLVTTTAPAFLGAGRSPLRHSRVWWVVAGLMTLSFMVSVIELPSRTPAPIAAVDYVAVLRGTYMPEYDPLPDARGFLVGPHFTFKIGGVATTSTIDKTTAHAQGLASPMRAAPGHEFVFASVETRGEAPRFESRGVSLGVAIVVDGAPRALQGLPRALQVLVVSVPEGAPAMLQVTDEGRALSMNLRDGLVPEDSVYRVKVSDDLAPPTYSGAGTVRALTASRPLNVSLELSDRASLDPFVPSSGWSGPGRTWLLLSGLRAKSDAMTGWDPRKGQFPVTFRLDTAATFRLSLPDGTLVRPQAQPPVQADEFAVSPWGFAILFSVPESFDTGTLRITPDGPMSATFRDGTLPARWSAPPAPAELPIRIRD